jgi:hypothetical protein
MVINLPKNTNLPTTNSVTINRKHRSKQKLAIFKESRNQNHPFDFACH